MSNLTPILTLEGLDGYEDDMSGLSGAYDGVDEQILLGAEQLLKGWMSVRPELFGKEVTETLYDFNGIVLSDDDIDHLSACESNVELQGFAGFGDAGLGWKAFKKLRKKLKSVAKKPLAVVKSSAFKKLTNVARRAIQKGISMAAKAGLTKMIPAPYNIIAQGIEKYASKIPGLSAKLNQLKAALGPALQKAGVPASVLNDYVNTAIKAQVGKTQVSTAQSLKNVKSIQEKKLKDLTSKLAAQQKQSINTNLNIQKGYLELVAQINNMVDKVAKGQALPPLKIPNAIANSDTVKKILPTVTKTISTIRNKNVAKDVLIKDQSQNTHDILDLLY